MHFVQDQYNRISVFMLGKNIQNPKQKVSDHSAPPDLKIKHSAEILYTESGLSPGEHFSVSWFWLCWLTLGEANHHSYFMQSRNIQQLNVVTLFFRPTQISAGTISSGTFKINSFSGYEISLTSEL